MVFSMIYTKKKFEKRSSSQETEEDNNYVNAWDFIKGNLLTINNSCEIIRRSLKSSKMSTKMIKEHYNSQRTNYNELIQNTNVLLKNTGNSLKKAKVIIDSVNREVNLGSPKDFPGLSLKLPN